MRSLRSLALPLLAAGALTAGAAEPAPHLNLLVITADDLRPWLGSYGASWAHTPALDRLAAEGAVFERAFVPVAWCAPARTAVLTGLRPDTTRVYDIETHFRTTTPEAVTLPQYFRQHGYVTASLGKVFHESLDDPPSWSRPSWWPSFTTNSRAYATAANLALAAQHWRYARPTEIGPDDDDAYPDGQVARAATTFIAEHRDQPFFLNVGFYKPHLPFTAPARYWTLVDGAAPPPPPPDRPPEGAPPEAFLAWAEHHNYVGVPRKPAPAPLPPELADELVRGYLACIAYVDAQVGRVLDALDEAGLRERTLIVFWGDHGWKLGDYGQWSKNTNYDVDTRVPLLMAGPGITRGRRTAALVEVMDLYPTLTELAGLPAPPGLDARSFAAVARGVADTYTDAAFSQLVRNDTRSYTTYANATVMGQSIRTADHRLVRWLRRGRDPQPFALELYDHRDDPGETINRAADPAQARTVADLLRRLDDHFRPPFPNP
jgi:iduronate 2-sulfatase